MPKMRLGQGSAPDTLAARWEGTPLGKGGKWRGKGKKGEGREGTWIGRRKEDGKGKEGKREGK